ncbi:MAG: nitroreductase family protein, partial [Muribaculaceae bacterium]|nr:nitroreductase family protein [Muribaculaceae bacterium]
MLGVAVISGTMFCSCVQEKQEKTACINDNVTDNAVIETIMSRRSVRAYEERAVPRDTMEIITECGINAPNGMNKQEWEIRVVDNPDFINGVTKLFVKENPDATKDPAFKNIFRNAPTVVFIG